jgi:hypothetical protein
MNTACDHLLDREQLVTPVEAGDGVGGVGAAQPSDRHDELRVTWRGPQQQIRSSALSSLHSQIEPKRLAVLDLFLLFTVVGVAVRVVPDNSARQMQGRRPS